MEETVGGPMMYDAIFRQNAAISPDVDWSQLDSAFYTGAAHSS